MDSQKFERAEDKHFKGLRWEAWVSNGSMTIIVYHKISMPLRPIATNRWSRTSESIYTFPEPILLRQEMATAGSQEDSN